ncbi:MULTISPECIES: DUF6745 domain-containing protein [Actinomadura]|uniref:DUF6745 domain-containing protein n=1 Tax=Actinomadura litoris TaxID=2678616 RepID=A0A7K1L1Y3_9ACTN|nr:MULTISPECIES: hypothetical protein [Actinomadura]MBT2206491.1 hypothetical protein [Actinomadura sp. NEAU-AAG7]MUN38409.1 hypothetical protein [Actinomadura litoris]
MTVTARREAAKIRAEWLDAALSAEPTDRPTAEAAISRLYRLIGLPPPRFHWAASPVTAMETVPPGMRSRAAPRFRDVDEWPIARMLRTAQAELTVDLNSRLPWTPEAAETLARLEVRFPIAGSVRASLGTALLTAQSPSAFTRSAWNSVLNPEWTAYYDALRRMSGNRFTADQGARLDLWADVLRSCGPWWPHENFCIASERPVALHTEVSGENGERRPHRADGPALRYADGWEMHFWHGTPVPAWVVDEPSVQRIEREPNVEIRRCAIENLGWASYIDQAGLRLVASAADPGNPGSELRLYDLRRETRVLLAVNGSVERDGRRRRYGLTVPGSLDDPIAAAAWTYGLSAAEYSLLARRT